MVSEDKSVEDVIFGIMVVGPRRSYFGAFEYVVVSESKKALVW